MVWLARPHQIVIYAHFKGVCVVLLVETKVIDFANSAIVTLETYVTYSHWEGVTVN